MGRAADRAERVILFGHHLDGTDRPQSPGHGVGCVVLWQSGDGAPFERVDRDLGLGVLYRGFLCRTGGWCVAGLGIAVVAADLARLRLLYRPLCSRALR